MDDERAVMLKKSLGTLMATGESLRLDAERFIKGLPISEEQVGVVIGLINQMIQTAQAIVELSFVHMQITGQAPTPDDEIINAERMKGNLDLILKEICATPAVPVKKKFGFDTKNGEADNGKY